MNKMLPELRTTFFSGWSNQVSEVYPFLGEVLCRPADVYIIIHVLLESLVFFASYVVGAFKQDKMFGVDLSRPPRVLWSRIPSCFTRMNHKPMVNAMNL